MLCHNWLPILFCDLSHFRRHPNFFEGLFSVTHFFSPFFRWPDSPARQEEQKKMVLELLIQHNGPVSGEETHSDGLLRGTSNCLIFSEDWWLKRQDSDTVFHHLKHNWVSLILYCRGLHHPQSFTATTNNKKVNYDLNRTGLDDKEQFSVFFISLLLLSCVPYVYWE